MLFYSPTSSTQTSRETRCKRSVQSFVSPGFISVKSFRFRKVSICFGIFLSISLLPCLLCNRYERSQRDFTHKNSHPFPGYRQKNQFLCWKTITTSQKVTFWLPGTKKRSNKVTLVLLLRSKPTRVRIITTLLKVQLGPVKSSRKKPRHQKP